MLISGLMASSAMEGSIPVAEKQYAPWINPRTQLYIVSNHSCDVAFRTYPAFRESNSRIDKFGKDIFGGVNTGCSVDRKRNDSGEDTAWSA